MNTKLVQKNKLFHIILALLIVIFCYFISPTIAIANSEQNTNTFAPVVLDGREIFQVTKAGEFSAQERAQLVNLQIEAIANSQKSPFLKIDERNESPVIIVNDRYLLTVTQADITEEIRPKQQAYIWGEMIKDAILQAQKERSSQFLWQTSFIAIALLICVIASHWLLKLLFINLQKKLLKVIEDNNSQEEQYLSSSMALNIFLNITFFIIKGVLWVSTLLYIANLFPLTRQWSYIIYQSLVKSFITSFISIGDKSYSIIDFFILLGLFLGLIIISGGATNFLRSRILKFTSITRGSQAAISILIKYTILSIGTIVLLQVWGLDLSSLTIFASAIGVAIGFGFQDIAKNFGSGLILLFERPIQVGDFLEIGNFLGTVEYIGARSTTIRTLDHVSIIVPNSRFLENEVINWSHLNPISRLHLPVGAAYSSDVSLVKKALLEATENSADILSKPLPQVLFKGFGDNSLDFELLVWICDPSKQPLIKSDLYFKIEANFRKYNIEIPFPQRDLHLRSGEFPLSLSSELEDKLNTLQYFKHKKDENY